MALSNRLPKACAEAAPHNRADDDILGTVQYTAPEYFLGERGSPRSDLFSLGVITYQMLTGKLPYGAGVARARTNTQMARPASPELKLSWTGAAHRAQPACLLADAGNGAAVHQCDFIVHALEIGQRRCRVYCLSDWLFESRSA